MFSAIKLSREEVGHFYSENDDNGKISNFIRKLDSSDTWTVDFSDSENHFEVINELEEVFNMYGDVLHIDPDKILYVLANITTSRCLYLVSEIAQRYPKLLNALELKISECSEMNESGGNAPPEVVKQRFDVVDRARLLNEIYNTNVYQRIFRMLAR